MAVTRVDLTERDEYLEQINRLVNSHALHGSETLVTLLRYLAAHVLTHPGEPLKEYEIATEVFHRPADFDPQLDSTIRVQAGRLRLKLAEYYGAEGAADPILVDLPKGGYLLTFQHRTAASHMGLSVAPLNRERRQTASRKWATTVLVLVVLLAAAIGVIFTMVANRTSAEAIAANHAEPAPAAFRIFW